MQLIFIIRYTLLEAYKKKLWLIYLLLLLLGVAAGTFTADISITETASGYSGFYAGIFRAGGILLLAIYLIMTESHALEEIAGPMFLALPVGRQQYLLAKGLAYMLLGLLISLMGILPLLVLQQPWVLWGWWLAFLAELWICVAVAWLLVLLFRQPLIAIMLFAVFYVFARISTDLSIQTVQVLHAGDVTVVTWCMAWLVEIATYLVPALDQYANTARLIYPTAEHVSIGYLSGETIIYCALLWLISLHEIRARQF